MRACFVGDVIVDHDIDAAGVRGALAAVAPDAELLVGNLEVPLCGEDAGSRATKQVAWRVPGSVAEVVSAAGFGAVSLANNHTTDWGLGGLVETVDVLRAAGVGVCGAGRSHAEALAPWLAPDGGRLAVLGLCCTTPPGSAAADGQPGLLGLRVGTRYEVDTWRLEELPATPPRMTARFSDDEIAPVEAAVREAAGRGAAVAVMVHWGLAWFTGVQSYQMDLAERLARAGAGLVLGHHSHTVAPVCRYRDTLVCFGLGDWLRSPSLVAWGDRQRPGLAADFDRFSGVGLALAVDVHDGAFARGRVQPFRLDAASGMPARPLGDDDAAVLSGWLGWQAELDLDGREGWTVAADVLPPARTFPLAAG